MVTSFFVEVVAKVILTIAFVLFNAMLIREAVAYFKAEDDTMITATAIAIWTGAVFFVLSFASNALWGWIFAILAYGFTFYLYKRYYLKPWNETMLMGEAWLVLLLYSALVVAALTTGM